MGLSGRADRKNSDISAADLAAEAASIEASVKLAEQLARDNDYLSGADAEAPPEVDDLAAELASIEASVRLAEALARNAEADVAVEKAPAVREAPQAEKVALTSVEGNDLAAEAASIEFSVRLAEQMAREAGIDAASWPAKKKLAGAPVESSGAPVRSVPVRPPAAADDLAAEAASIEFSVRLAERLAREGNLDGVPAAASPVPSAAPARDELAAEAASIEHSVKLAEKLAGDADLEGWPSKKAFLAAQRMAKARTADSRPLPSVKGEWAWPRLLGRTGKELRREAKYQMYFVYEHFPEDLKALAVQVIAKGCPELDEKGAKAFVTKVWSNKRLQENLQGAMNATYYRELFESEELRLRKRSIPDIYLDGENPRVIFDKMKVILFKKRDLPNRIYLVKTRKGYGRPLSTQLMELFEAEKARAAKRLKSDQASH